MEVIFARTRYDYQPYRDFWRVVELSDYPVVYVDQIDIHDTNKVYIITPVNGEWRAGWAQHEAWLIHLDLEWHILGVADCKQTGECIPGIDETWVSDAWYSDLIGAKYVPLGSHPGLARNEETRGGLYDVAMMAAPTSRRLHISNELLKLNISVAPNGWDDNRHNILTQTRAMMNVHQHNGVNVVAPQRFMIAAAYHLPIISERATHPGIFEHTCLWSDYAYLPEFAKMWLKPENELHLWDFGHALYQQLCVHRNFRKSIEAAL